VSLGEVQVLHIPSYLQFADVMMNGLSSQPFLDFQSSLCIREPIVLRILLGLCYTLTGPKAFRASPASRILALNRVQFGPFALSREHERGVVLPLDHLGREQAQRPDAFGQMATFFNYVKLLFLKAI
jgi:hypothetical protein